MSPSPRFCNRGFVGWDVAGDETLEERCAHLTERYREQQKRPRPKIAGETDSGPYNWLPQSR